MTDNLLERVRKLEYQFARKLALKEVDSIITLYHDGWGPIRREGCQERLANLFMNFDELDKSKDPL